MCSNNNKRKTIDGGDENKPTVEGMDSLSARGDRPKRTNKLGDFFSRLTSFRFSARKKHQQQPETNRNLKQTDALNKSVLTQGGIHRRQEEQQQSTKVDYIYIPLKDPKVNNNDDENQKKSKGTRSGHAGIRDVGGGTIEVVSSGKPPPVPKMPPKVIGASVKKRQAHTTDEPDSTRNRIDSGTTCPMEQMGLIETDLDTEVTVITSGAHVKTRSLMNLGADAPQKCLVAPQVTNRPHKSMEFLLDKQNLKVVEVSFSHNRYFFFV